MKCGPGDLPMLVHNILNVLNNRMGRPPSSHLKDIWEGIGEHISQHHGEISRSGS